MMDLYSGLVEGLLGGPMITLIILTMAIFLYLAWCRIGIFTNLQVMGLFVLIYTWVTGKFLITFVILLFLWYGAFIEFKKELSEG